MSTLSDVIFPITAPIGSAWHADYNHTDTESTETNLCIKQVSGLFYYDSVANRSAVFILLANQEAVSAWCGCEVRCMFVKLFYDRHRREETTRQECLRPKENDESLCFTKLHMPADNSV